MLSVLSEYSPNYEGSSDSTSHDKSAAVYASTSSPDTEMGKRSCPPCTPHCECMLCSAVGEETGKLMGDEGSFSLLPMDTAVLTQHNGPVGGYSPPSDGEGMGQMTSDEE